MAPSPVEKSLQITAGFSKVVHCRLLLDRQANKPLCHSSCSLPDSLWIRATNCVRGRRTSGSSSHSSRSLLYLLLLLLSRSHHHEMDPTDFFDVFSEEYTSFPSGSFFYCHPSEVETWNQSVPFEDFSLPTPPDSNSDCGSVDSQDMPTQTWSQASQPEEWTPTSAQEYSTYLQPSANGWSNGMPVTAQDVQSLDHAAWLSVSSGPVDQGLSPVLSHESQSTHTLNSFPEPDACVLPPGLDLSFTEQSWNPSAPTVYSQSPSAFQSAEQGFAQSHEHAGKANGFVPFPQGYYPGASMLYPQGSQVAYAPRTSYPALAPKRQLLPRTEGSPQTMPATHGPQRVLRPYVQGQHDSHASSNVSSAAGPLHEGQQHTSAQAGSSFTCPAQGTQSVANGVRSAPVFTQPSAVPQASATSHYMVDPTAQDFSDFIHFDQEEHITSPAQMRSDRDKHSLPHCDTDRCASYAHGFDVQSAPSSVPVDSKDVILQPEQDASATYQGPGSESFSLANDTEEGRHRSHPLYAAEPQADGLFHCPYKAKDPNCPHKPTKLKCNYEYDSPSQLTARETY